MKENKYDDIEFFEKYSKMPRSVYGLAGAGEWEALSSIMPILKDKRVVDLGCGYGWHCVYAIQEGAKSVVGVDISSKMLEIAKSNDKNSNIEYICSPMEDIAFKDNSFDVAISSLAIHYIADFSALVKKVNGIIDDGGKFIFTVEHPIFTAEGSQNWVCDRDGNKLHFPMDNYFSEGKRRTNFLGESVVKYHRTLTTYLNTLIENGFVIDNIVEPTPPQSMMSLAGMSDELRRPMMLIISATKVKQIVLK